MTHVPGEILEYFWKSMPYFFSRDLPVSNSTGTGAGFLFSFYLYSEFFYLGSN